MKVVYQESNKSMGCIRKDPNNHTASWSLGVESHLKHHCVLKYPGNLIYNKQISNIEPTDRVYQTVDLSAPPCDKGFQHVQLTISEYPVLTKGDDSKLLMIKSEDTFYLGTVITTQDVDSLLLHKIFVDNVSLLENILDMHTSLQVHLFVPRTFALQMMKTAFVNTSGVGMFIGEAAGDWNLGCANGMDTVTTNEKYTMTYHILKCLLRVQIISIRVLGFTMKRIQPARIWKWRDGFRVTSLVAWLTLCPSGTKVIPFGEVRKV